MSTLTCSHGTTMGRLCSQCMDNVIATCKDDTANKITALETQIREKDMLIQRLERTIAEQSQKCNCLSCEN